MAQDRMRNYGDMSINRTRDSRARTFGGFLRRIQARLHRGRKTAHSLQYMAFCNRRMACLDGIWNGLSLAVL